MISEATTLNCLFVIDFAKRKGEATDNPETRSIGPADVFRESYFDDRKRSDLDQAILILEKIGVITNRESKSSGGRPRETCLVSLIGNNEVRERIAATFPAEPLPPVPVVPTTVNYYHVPESLMAELEAEVVTPLNPKASGSSLVGGKVSRLPVFTPEHREDIIDAYHAYRASLDNFIPIDEEAEKLSRALESSAAGITRGPTAFSRQVLVSDIQRYCARFRKSPPARLDETFQLMEGLGGICVRSLPGESPDTITFFECILPSSHWERSSPTRKLYTLSADDAMHRFLKTLLGHANQLKALPTEPESLPQKLIAAQDFRCMVDGFLHAYPRGYVFEDPIFIRQIIKTGMPVIPLDHPLAANFCPACSAPGVVAELDTSDEVRYLKVLGEFSCMANVNGASYLMTFKKNDVITEKSTVDWFRKSYPSAHVEPIRAHEFIICERCLNNPNGCGKRTVYFPLPLPTPNGIPSETPLEAAS